MHSQEIMSKILNKNNNRIINGLHCKTKPVQLQTRKSCSMHDKSKGHVSTSKSCGKKLDSLLLFKENVCPLHNIESMTFLSLLVHCDLNTFLFSYTKSSVFMNIMTQIGIYISLAFIALSNYAELVCSFWWFYITIFILKCLLSYKNVVRKKYQ